MSHGSRPSSSAVARHARGRRLLIDNTSSLSTCLPSWSMDLCQLEPGYLQTTLSQVDLPGIHIARLQANQSLEFMGRVPAHRPTILVPAHSDQPFSWTGRTHSADQPLLLPAGSSINATALNSCDVFTISLTKDHLAGRLLGPLKRCLYSNETWILNHVDVARLRQALITLDEAVVTGSTIPKILDVELIAAFSQATSRRQHSLRRRDEGLIRARRLITEAEGQDLTLEDLCSAAQVSHRTLVYAFRDHYGIPPKRFLVVYRLNGVRRDFFRHGHAGTKIIDVASHWGFWHMGQFASDYRRLFGELPSTTLNKISAARSSDDIDKPVANISQHHGWTWFPTPTWSLA